MARLLKPVPPNRRLFRERRRYRGPCAGLALLPLLCTACTAERTLDLTPFSTAKTLIVATHDADQVRQLLVLTSSGGIDQDFDLSVLGLDAPLITILASERSAAELRLKAGALQTLPDGEPLPDLPLRYTRRWQDQDWSSFTVLPPSLAAVRVKLEPIPDPCPQIRPEQLLFDSLARSGWAATLTSSVVVATIEGEFFIVDRDRRITNTLGANFFFWGVAALRGQLLVGSRACIYRAIFEGGRPALREALYCQPEGREGGMLVAGKSGFAVAREDGVAFVDSSTQTLLRAALDLYEVGTLTPDNELVLASRAEPRSVRFATKQRTWIEPIELVADEINSLAWVEGMGLMVGDSGGNVYVRDTPGHWRSLGDPGFFTAATGFAPLPDGFLVTGDTAEGAVFLNGHGFCDVVPMSSGPLPAITRLGSGYLFFGQRHSTSRFIGASWVDLGL